MAISHNISVHCYVRCCFDDNLFEPGACLKPRHCFDEWFGMLKYMCIL